MLMESRIWNRQSLLESDNKRPLKFDQNSNDQQPDDTLIISRII